MRILIKYISILILTLGILASCTKDFEEINTNPHGFTNASDGSLYNGVIQRLAPKGNELFYINSEILYKQTQLLSLTRAAWGNFTLGTEASWGNYYLSLPNLRELEKRFETMSPSDELSNMKAMIKIILAYETFKITDMFGDIPFFHAGYGFHTLEYLHPEYDSQKTIYLYLLEELKWCDENINTEAVNDEPFKTFRVFDALFNGDMLQYQKFANSLRLRYAMRMSDKEPELAGQIIRDIVENERPIFLGYDFLDYVGESACLWPAQMGFTNGAIDWAFYEHKNLRVGSNVWHMVSSNDNINGDGIFDPRAYIFFEPNNANEWVAYPQIPDNNTPAPGGIPYGTHRDGLTTFTVKGETNNYSFVNYFMHRDYNNIPILMISGAEVHFILAEAYMKGVGVAQDPEKADIEYMEGINSSVEWWVDVSNNSVLPLSQLKFPDMINIPEGINAASVLSVFGSWNAPSDEDKLKFIYTQRMLDAFWQPWEAYALARRTNMTAREGDPINHFRLPYPPSEQEFNMENMMKAKQNQGGDSPEDKIWWINY